MNENQIASYGIEMQCMHDWASDSCHAVDRGRVVWLLASLAYGVIIGSVAIQFPMGSAICRSKPHLLCMINEEAIGSPLVRVLLWPGLTFLVLYGFGVVGTYYIRLEGISRATPLRQWWSWGRRPVLQYFLQAYMVALTMVVTWIAISGGFVGRNGDFR